MLSTILATLFGGVALQGAPTPASLDCRLANPRIEQAIKRTAAAHGGDEYCQFRSYHNLADLDADGIHDLVVLFNVEARGGTDTHGFLAVFLSTQDAAVEPLLIPAGQRGERLAVGIANVQEGRITLTTREYSRGDPLCCPTRTGVLSFEIVNTTLRRIQARKRGGA